jgi:EAL domain-containing protein (putative c-di-GMP-specific phosphodiesterase class I)
MIDCSVIKNHNKLNHTSLVLKLFSSAQKNKILLISERVESTESFCIHRVTIDLS